MTTTYRLADRDLLVVRAADARWQSVRLRRKDFRDIGAATAGELVAALAGLEGITAAEEEGRLVLTSRATGDDASVEVDLAASTAAAALGLRTPGPSAPPSASARGAGLTAARLVGTTAEPFTLPARATMTVRIDGRGRRVVFPAAGSPRSAVDVAEVIRSVLRRDLAGVTADGRVTVTSPTVGLGSAVGVRGPSAPNVPDAAGPLGFVGAAADSRPYRSDPARLVCVPAPDRTGVVNLTSGPLELHLPSGAVVVPARGRIELAREVAADPVVRRLVERGAAGLVPPSPPD